MSVFFLIYRQNKIVVFCKFYFLIDKKNRLILFILQTTLSTYLLQQMDKFNSKKSNDDSKEESSDGK
jgi:hypothetical protein